MGRGSGPSSAFTFGALLLPIAGSYRILTVMTIREPNLRDGGTGSGVASHRISRYGPTVSPSIKDRP
jgi:hypothetical protein